MIFSRAVMFELKFHPAVNNCQKQQSRFASAGCITLITNMRITSAKSESKASATIQRASGKAAAREQTARRGDETANNEIANLNGGNPTITSGRDHVIVAARSADGSTQVILDS
ncbi:MAG: hypothetical protein C5S52_03225 [ANME-2 cluster archaeon]|nr:hypothetical protein [ANME-2 cluster archaeon]